jgi:hypothetical protein
LNTLLITYLKNNIGKPITSEIAADICTLADALPQLITPIEIANIPYAREGDFIFWIEKMADIEEEMKPLHQAHWKETESHRHDLELNPDYATFTRYERAGRYILFTMRKWGKLVGACAMYLSPSTHTQTLIATEDTLYLLPEARQGKAAKEFIYYCETALQLLGVREISVSVKVVNKAGRFFQMLGYQQTEIGLTKILEDLNVCA